MHAHIAINLYILQKCTREKTEITEGHSITPSNQLFTYTIWHKRVTYKTKVIASYTYYLTESSRNACTITEYFNVANEMYSYSYI